MGLEQTMKTNTIAINGVTYEVDHTHLARVLRLMEGVDRDYGRAFTPEMVMRHVAPMLMGRDQEAIAVVIFDNAMRVIGAEIVSMGSVNQCLVPVAVLFRRILMAGGNAFVMAHNHPSGDPTPSAQDIEVTERVARGAKLLDLQFLDHLVVVDEVRWVSMKDRHLM